MKRRCLIRDLYNRFTPHVQLIGWVLVLVAILVPSKYYITAVDAQEIRLNEHDATLHQIKEDLAEIKGGISVIKEYTKPKR